MRSALVLALGLVASVIPITACRETDAADRGDTEARPAGARTATEPREQALRAQERGDLVPIEVERLALRFSRPDSFLVGRFAPQELPAAAAEAGLDPPFVGAVVLVEPRVLERSGFSLDSIPVGEIPVIWIDRSDLTLAIASRIMQPETTFTVAVGTVHRLPGFPGPYGDQAHYYLIEPGDGRPIEIGAHRYHFRDGDPPPPTGYDRVIEAILPTIGVLER